MSSAFSTVSQGRNLNEKTESAEAPLFFFCHIITYALMYLDDKYKQIAMRKHWSLVQIDLFTIIINDKITTVAIVDCSLSIETLSILSNIFCYTANVSSDAFSPNCRTNGCLSTPLRYLQLII